MTQGTPATFFVVATLTGNANQQTPHQFQVTHPTESSTTAEDRITDTPLLLEYTRNVSSSSVLAGSLISNEDHDGLREIVETNTGIYVSPSDTGTDPFDWDSDGDGYADGLEVNLGHDPNDPDDHPDMHWVPALGPRGHALLLLALAGAGASSLRLRRWRG